MTKNKAQKAQKAKARRNLKDRRKEATRKIKPVVGKKEVARREQAKMEATLPPERYARWLAHGINFFVSDLDQGHWRPIFDDIYEGGNAPSPERIAQVVIQKFGNPTAGTFQEKLQRVCIAWTVAPSKHHYFYIKEAERRLKTEDPEINVEEALFAPHKPTVWRLLHEIREQLLATS